MRSITSENSLVALIAAIWLVGLALSTAQASECEGQGQSQKYVIASVGRSEARTVHGGNRVRKALTGIKGFVFYGNKVFTQDQLSEPFVAQVGKPESLSQLDQAINDIEDRYRDQGHVLARVVDVREEPEGIINIVINEGVIAELKFAGNHKTRAYVLSRYLKQKIGSSFNESTLVAGLRKLARQGYFSSIQYSIEPAIDSPGGYSITITVEEKENASSGLGGASGCGMFPPPPSPVRSLSFNGHGMILQSVQTLVSAFVRKQSSAPIPGSGRYLLNQLEKSSILTRPPEFKNLGSFVGIQYVELNAHGQLPTICCFRFNGVWYDQYIVGEIERMTPYLMSVCRSGRIVHHQYFDDRSYLLIRRDFQMKLERSTQIRRSAPILVPDTKWLPPHPVSRSCSKLKKALT